MVLSKASPKTFAIKAKSWSESVHKFLKQCADAGNVEACYTLGMVSCFSDSINCERINKKIQNLNSYFNHLIRSTC